MSLVWRSDRAWARSVSSGIDVITPPTTSASGRCRPASSPQALASCSSDRRLASSLASGAPSALLRIAIGDTPLSSLIPHPATFRFLHTTPWALRLPRDLDVQRAGSIDLGERAGPHV